MPFNSRPFFFFPAAVIGIGLAILFFKVYGTATKPDIPAPIAEATSFYAPGIELGKPVNASRAVGELRWVRYVGFVSDQPRAGFVQTWLLVSPEEAAKETGNREAIVDAVELVSTTDAPFATEENLSMRFHAQPKAGCVTSPAPLGERSVSFWTTRNDLGGFALINGFSKLDTIAGNAAKKAYEDKQRAARDSGRRSYDYPPAPPRVNGWSMLIWNGKLDGPRTMRANFQPRHCGGVGGDEREAAGLEKTFAATDAMILAFDVVASKEKEIVLQASTRAQMDSAGRFAEACFGTNMVHTDGWTRRDFSALPISVLMPPEYSRRRAGASDGPDSLAQTYVAPDGSTIWFARQSSRVDLSGTPDLGMETECEATIGGIAAHLETGRRLPAMTTKTTSAAYQLPTGAWLVVMASAPTAERQQQHLRMIREVQFARQWSKPPANVPHIAIDSL